jgi:polyhydroxyalkanoate synthesis regulator phasin
MSTDKLPKPVHSGSLLANEDVYLARDVHAALAAQAEAHAAEQQRLLDELDAEVIAQQKDNDALRAEVEALTEALGN